MSAITLTSRQEARPGAGVTPQSQVILRPAGGLPMLLGTQAVWGYGRR